MYQEYDQNIQRIPLLNDPTPYIVSNVAIYFANKCIYGEVYISVCSLFWLMTIYRFLFIHSF